MLREKKAKEKYLKSAILQYDYIEAGGACMHVIDSVCLFGRLHVFHFLSGEKVHVLEGAL